jgi:hypothetical protein
MVVWINGSPLVTAALERNGANISRRDLEDLRSDMLKWDPPKGMIIELTLLVKFCADAENLVVSIHVVDMQFVGISSNNWPYAPRGCEMWDVRCERERHYASPYHIFDEVREVLECIGPL